MKHFLRSSAIATLLFFSSNGFAQQLDWNIAGSGARAEGFGGAFIGVADDATAVVWNPAGLSQLQRPEASVVVRFITESSDLTYAPNPSFNQSTTQSHTVLNFGSAALPFKLGATNVVVAAAYQRQLDFYGSEKQSTSQWDETGGVDTFTPGIGIQVTPVVSVGFATNIWFGKDKYTSKDESSSPTQNTNVDGSASGLNFVFGGLVDFSGLSKPFPLKLGVTVRTPFSLKISRTYTWDPPIGGIVDQLGATTTAQMPLMLGFGASYRIGENLTVAADYEMRGYGNKEYETTYDQYLNSDKGPMSDSKKDLNQFRVGAEYLIVADAGVFPIRAGFQTVPTVLAYYDANGNPTDQVKGNGFAVGTGFISGSFALDVTYSRSSYDAGDPFTTIKIAKSAITGSLIVYF